MILAVATWQRTLGQHFHAMATIGYHTPTGEWLAPDDWDEEETPESLMLWCLHGRTRDDGSVVLDSWHSPVAAIKAPPGGYLGRSWH